MLNETISHFGTGCGGASVADVLAPKSDAPLPDLKHRLLRVWAPIACVLSNRQVLIQPADDFAAWNALAVPVRVGAQSCILHLSPQLVEWLQQPLQLDHALAGEAPLQRALLLELASLDLVRFLEAQLGEDIRFGAQIEADDPGFFVDLAIAAEEQLLALRIGLPLALAQKWADIVDRLSPPKPIDHSGLRTQIAVQAGFQDLAIDELASLQPGDVVMLASFRPTVAIQGKLIAAARRQSDGFELVGAFSPGAERAMAASLAELRGEETDNAAHILTVSFEMGRATMTLGEIDALQPGQRLPFAQLEETGVDIVVADRRIGRGELIAIGTGLGVRIIHILPSATARNSQTS